MSANLSLYSSDCITIGIFFFYFFIYHYSFVHLRFACVTAVVFLQRCLVLSRLIFHSYPKCLVVMDLLKKITLFGGYLRPILHNLTGYSRCVGNRSFSLLNRQSLCHLVFSDCFLYSSQLKTYLTNRLCFHLN